LESTETLRRTRFWGKLQIQAESVRHLREDQAKVAHKCPSNNFLKQISRDLASNVKNEKSPKILPKIPKRWRRRPSPQPAHVPAAVAGVRTPLRGSRRRRSEPAGWGCSAGRVRGRRGASEPTFRRLRPEPAGARRRRRARSREARRARTPRPGGGGRSPQDGAAVQGGFSRRAASAALGAAAQGGVGRRAASAALGVAARGGFGRWDASAARVRGRRAGGKEAALDFWSR